MTEYKKREMEIRKRMKEVEERSKEHEILDTLKKCQRNWDYKKFNSKSKEQQQSIVYELLYTAQNSPSKQYESYFDLTIQLIEKLYKKYPDILGEQHIEEPHQQIGETHKQMLVSILYGLQKNLKQH